MAKVWEPRDYNGVISVSRLFTEPRNRVTLDPYRVDELHSAIVKLIVDLQGGNKITLSDFVAVLTPFEVEKPEGY